jgi:hypothetical protein
MSTFLDLIIKEHTPETLTRDISNDIMNNAAILYKLPTVSVNDIVYTSLNALSKVFRYSNISSIWYVIKKYNAHHVKVKSFDGETQTTIQKALGLSKRGNSALLVTGDAFLLVALHRQSKIRKGR